VFRKGTGKGRAWCDGTGRSNPARTIDYGERYVVIGAGGRKGFIPGTWKIFPTKKKHQPGDDYHGDMNSEVFLSWFRVLLANLKEDSVIVLDNASYHRAKV